MAGFVQPARLGKQGIFIVDLVHVDIIYMIYINHGRLVTVNHGSQVTTATGHGHFLPWGLTMCWLLDGAA